MTRGFAIAEFRARAARLQAAMTALDLDALWVTTQVDLAYLTGFQTGFWHSPTRPWFVVLPAMGDPIAVIPSIGEALMAQTWVTDIRCWRAPDYGDDGVTLLAETLSEITPTQGRIGTPSGIETHLRMPLDDFERLKQHLGRLQIVSDGGILRDVRAIKSDAEVAKIRMACGIADRAFARVPEIAGLGVPRDAVFRRFQMLCIEEGADDVPYLAGGAGPDGYHDVISPAVDDPLTRGDVLMLDTGLRWDGYHCDFDRNWAIGQASPAAQDAHARLIAATQAGFDAARPGATAADLFHAMDTVVSAGVGGSSAGRLGHGLGLHLTEGLSLVPFDHTPLAPGMVLTLEPGVSVGTDRLMVHEENIVITSDGAAWLSTPAGPDLPVLM